VDLTVTTSAIARRYEISPLREHTFEAVEDHVVDLHDIIQGISEDLIRLQGQDSQTPRIHNDMDFNANRAMNMRDPVEMQDAVTLRYLKRWWDAYQSSGKKPGDRL